MKLNTLEKLYLTMEHELPELQMDDEPIEKSLLPMQRMMEVSKKAGLLK